MEALREQGETAASEPVGSDQQRTREAKPSRAKKAASKGRRKKAAKRPPSTPRVVVSAEQLPRKSLEQSLRIARALRDVLAGGPADWPQIASAMGITATTQINKYYLWSAQAYGLVEREADSFSLTENARKILAPTRPNEDKEALIKAVLSPVIFSRFFTDYNTSPFPAEEHIGNVLEVRYGVPRERVEEAKSLLRENGLFAGILRQESDGSMIVRLDPSTTGVPSPPEPPPGVPLDQVQSVPAVSLDYSKMCFVITPIGEDDSEERRHADMVLGRARPFDRNP